ncbi:hypothetical protein ACGFYZ_39615 [Streptomyces sp. NPDC048330]|uniref:hypothetical protein n=1 Tax=Streptomyces sp. NPDC048330 TaxID=3365533 RepID=UPI003720E8C7
MATGDDATAARLTPEVEQLPGLLPAIAELVVFPVTALSNDTDPCADSFVLHEVGILYLMAIREWATHAPATAAPAIARALAHFVVQFLADAPTDAIRTLTDLRNEQWRRPARWWCTSDRTRHRVGAHPPGAVVRAPLQLARGSDAHRMLSTRWSGPGWRRRRRCVSA